MTFTEWRAAASRCGSLEDDEACEPPDEDRLREGQHEQHVQSAFASASEAALVAVRDDCQTQRSNL